VKLIAEFCQNHMGSRQILIDMLQAAKESGATHAKIQGLYSHELTFRPEFENPSSSYYRPYRAEVERLGKLDLDEATESWFVENSLALKLIPMITVFTHSGATRAKEAGFRSIKIASYDCASWSLIDSVMEFAAEIVVSTGATKWSDVARTAKKLIEFETGGKRAALLHARTLYPCTSELTNLSRMNALKVFGLPIGFSDHSRPAVEGLFAAKLAMLLGADYIERHFTILGDKETKDGPVSVNPCQLKELSQFANLDHERKLLELTLSPEDFQLFLGNSELEPNETEQTNAKYYRGRVASQINGKTVFSWEKVGKQ